jgi:hypothetical protein
MLAAVVLGLLAQHPLASDDAQARLEAVRAWAKKQKKPQLSSRDARAMTECIEVPPVKETGCEQPAKLCRLHEGDDGASGTRIEALSLLLDGHAQPLRVWWSATYEPAVADCDPPEKLEGHESPEAHAAETAAWRKAHAKEYARCVARVTKDAKDDAEELACEVVLVNACRQEAFLTCKGRNLRQRGAALEQLHRVALSP